LKSLFLATLLATALATAAGLNKGLDKNNVLNQAHESYLEGDFRQTLMNIKIGLEQFDRDPIMKKNLLGLYADLLHTGKLKNIDLGWTLPPEVLNLRLSIERESDQDVLYFLTLSGDIMEENIVKSIKITRYPDLVVVDSENKIGRFREHRDQISSKLSFVARTQKTTLKTQPGLYTADITTKNGNSVKAWFIVDDSMNASVSPEFKKLSTNFKNGLPHFAWKELTTPEYNPKEKRELYFEISKNIEPSNWKAAWSIWESTPQTTEIQVGKTKPELSNELPLENGSYMALLQFIETTRLGNIRINRKTTQTSDFKINSEKK